MADSQIVKASDPPARRVSLQQMPQQVIAFGVVDDWTGVTDPTTRRRLQNRLNQRAYRSRQEAGIYQRNGHTGAMISGCEHGAPRPTNSRRGRKKKSTSQVIPTTSHTLGHNAPPWTWAPPNLSELMIIYERQATESYLQGSPQRDHLLSISKLNIWRAANYNVVAAGMTIAALWADEALSIFNMSIPDLMEEKVPASLRPTAIQKNIPHHPWLDIFPFPRMRDNIIRAVDNFDDDDLCHDLMTFWNTHATDATLLVWGVPWDPANWEVTEAFARKWGWMLHGCPEIFASTNFWRQKRGEKKLRI